MINVLFRTVGSGAILGIRAKDLCDGNMNDFYNLVNAIGRDELLGFTDNEAIATLDLAAVADAASKNPEAQVCVFW